MKNFQNYTPEKYAGPAYTPVEEGIYLGKNPYWQPGFGQEEIYVTSLSFEMEPERFGEEGGARRRRMAGLLLKGLADRREAVRQEALHILGSLFASRALGYEEKTSLFTLISKKLLFLIGEQPGEELTFFYTAASLSHIYRFIVLHKIQSGPFQFETPEKAAFFPGTFDPFSLSHKGIVQAIRDLGFEV